MYEQYLKLLKQLIPFKSLSTDSSFKSEIDKTVDWLDNLFKDNKFKVQTFTGYSNPMIVASYEFDPKLPTCLIYGHYDVQPALITDGWDSEPFTVVERNGRLFARGSVDNKGQVLIHIATILDLIEKNNLKYNIKFFLEGDEESGSPLLEKFMTEHAEDLKADFVVLSDGEIDNRPTIELSSRGLVNTTLTLKTAKTDLHSGLYGGAAPNAVYELSKLLSKIYDKDNKVTIKGFYNSVTPISKEEQEIIAQREFSLDSYTKITGAKAILTEPEFNFYAQVGLRPSVNIVGITGGYQEEGYKTAIPYKASAKINFRLVEDQDPKEVIKQFEKFVKENLPEYVEYELKNERNEGSAKAVKLDYKNKYVAQAIKVLEEVWNDKVVYEYVGGTLPVMKFIKDILKTPQISVPLCNNDCNMHGANENFSVDLIKKGLEFSRKFFQN